MLAGSLALHLTVAKDYRHLLARARALGRERIVLWGWAASITQSLLAGGGAYVMGRVLSLLAFEVW